MTPHNQGSEDGPPVSAGSTDEDDISLRPLFQALWAYRWVMVFLGCAVGVGFVFWGIFTYVTQPMERQASVEFRLLFDGASNNQYPNGLSFSHSEIVAGTILPEVHQANELGRYLNFDDFKRGVVVLGTNSEVELLNLEYQAKLGGSGITQVERVALEQEFEDRREALRSAHYRLSFFSPGGAAPIPDELMRKALSDILAEWADQAVSRKGVLSYLVRPLNTTVLSKELLAASEHFVKADILRGQVDNVLKNLSSLEDLPGAANFRTPDGVTVEEARLNLEALVRYRLEPLTAHLWSNGLFVNTAEVETYVQNRLFQIELALNEAIGLGRTLQDSLRDYVAGNMGVQGAPEFGANVSGRASGGSDAQNQRTLQIGDAFLERIIDLAGASVDVEFRQALTTRIIEAGEVAVARQRDMAYYQQVSGLVRQAAGGSPDPEALKAAAVELDTVAANIGETVGQVGLFYDELANQNLNAEGMLFEVTSPFAVTVSRAIAVQTLGLYGLLTLLAALVAVPLICLLHFSFRRLIQTT